MGTIVTEMEHIGVARKQPRLGMKIEHTVLYMSRIEIEAV